MQVIRRDAIPAPVLAELDRWRAATGHAGACLHGAGLDP